MQADVRNLWAHQLDWVPDAVDALRRPLWALRHVRDVLRVPARLALVPANLPLRRRAPHLFLL